MLAALRDNIVKRWHMPFVRKGIMGEKKMSRVHMFH